MIQVGRRTLRVVATVTMLATLVGSCGNDARSAPCPPSIYRSNSTLIIAHAGGDFFGPPNTIEMMRAAKAAGADILDADVRITKDGVLVAAHDDLVQPASGPPVSRSFGAVVEHSVSTCVDGDRFRRSSIILEEQPRCHRDGCSHAHRRAVLAARRRPRRDRVDVGGEALT